MVEYPKSNNDAERARIIAKSPLLQRHLDPIRETDPDLYYEMAQAEYEKVEAEITAIYPKISDSTFVPFGVMVLENDILPEKDPEDAIALSSALIAIGFQIGDLDESDVVFEDILKVLIENSWIKITEDQGEAQTIERTVWTLICVGNYLKVADSPESKDEEKRLDVYDNFIKKSDTFKKFK